MKQQHTGIHARLAQLRMKHGASLIVVSCLVQLLLSSQVLAAHPLLEETLSVLNPICVVLGLCILALVSLRFVFGKLTAGGRRLVKMWQRGARTLRALIFGLEQENTCVTPEEVRQVWKHQLHLNQQLFLAISEKKQTGQAQGETPVQLLPVPTAPYAHLLAECDGLARLLRHLGFPELDQRATKLAQVRLSQRDYTLIRQWQASLYTRFYQIQQRVQTQQEAKQATLFAARALLETMSLHPAAQDEPGYHRVLGSYELLISLAQDHRTPPEVVLERAQGLRRTMETVREHLHASQQPKAATEQQPRNGSPARHHGSRKSPKTGTLHHRPS